MTVDFTKPVVALIDQDSDFRSLTLEVLGLREIQVLVFDSAQEFLNVSLHELTGPRCVVIDLGLEGMSAITIEEELRRRGSRIPIIAASGVGDIPIAIQALREGARMLLQKPVAPPELADCIANALEDDLLGLRARQDHAALAAHIKDLSSREFEVMELLIRARNSKEIATVLGIGVQTVLKHRTQVLRKLGVRNDVELALGHVPPDRNGRPPRIAPPHVLLRRLVCLTTGGSLGQPGTAESSGIGRRSDSSDLDSRRGDSSRSARRRGTPRPSSGN